MTSNGTPRPFKRNREDAFKEARKDFGDDLTRADDDTIRLLDKVRDYKFDWSLNKDGDMVSKPIVKPSERSAALLHQRGQKRPKGRRCERCKKQGVWRSCVVAPVYKNRSIHSFACSNCLFTGKSSCCSLRKSFVDGNGQKWNSADTEVIVQNGGLHAAIKRDREGGSEPEEPAQKKRKGPGPAGTPRQGLSVVVNSPRNGSSPRRLEGPMQYIDWPLYLLRLDDADVLDLVLKEIQWFWGQLKRRRSEVNDPDSSLETASDTDS